MTTPAGASSAPAAAPAEGKAAPTGASAPASGSAAAPAAAGAGNGSNGHAAGGPIAARERALFAYAALVGCPVRLEAPSGAAYEGVVASIADGAVTLRFARCVADPARPGLEPRLERPEDTRVFAPADWARLDAAEARLGAADVGPAGAGDDAGGFGTDAAISRGRGGAEGRALERWAPEAGAPAFGGLEDGRPRGAGRGAGASTAWDQFSLNEARFGVRSDYREEIYTTALDPSKSTISVAQANRIAAEIERAARAGGPGANLHLAEERGLEVDDSGIDEEDKYSGVVRRPASAGGAPGGGAPGGGAPRPAGAWGRGAPAGAAARSAAVPIADPRREVNKVRASLGGRRGSSPYGTPKSPPLRSPLVGDPAGVDALCLEPGAPRVAEGTRRELEAFKAAQAAADGGGAGGAPGGAAAEMRAFSDALGSKLRAREGGAAAPAGGAAATGAAAERTPAAAAAAPAPAAGGLNPNAKEFSFNISAAEFKPSFTPAAPAAGGGGGGGGGGGPRGQRGPRNDGGGGGGGYYDDGSGGFYGGVYGGGGNYAGGNYAGGVYGGGGSGGGRRRGDGPPPPPPGGRTAYGLPPGAMLHPGHPGVMYVPAGGPGGFPGGPPMGFPGGPPPPMGAYGAPGGFHGGFQGGYQGGPGRPMPQMQPGFPMQGGGPYPPPPPQQGPPPPGGGGGGPRGGGEGQHRGTPPR
jgi:hypothetical protein